MQRIKGEILFSVLPGFVAALKCVSDRFQVSLAGYKRFKGSSMMIISF